MKQGRASTNNKDGRQPTIKSMAVGPGYAADLGIMKGNHATEGGDLPYNPRRMHTGPSFQGDQTNRMKMGPGGGRIVRRSGSQGKW